MNNVYLCHSVDNKLYHHGIKGQKWGLRNYQYADGSLTEEGRRRYGRNGTPISYNTRESIKRHAKAGAKVGAALGVASGVAGAGILAVSGIALPPAAAVGVGAAFVAAHTTAGTLKGVTHGAISGALETHEARKYLAKGDNRNVKMKDLNKNTKRKK